jgi:hypothetical protein
MQGFETFTAPSYQLERLLPKRHMATITIMVNAHVAYNYCAQWNIFRENEINHRGLKDRPWCSVTFFNVGVVVSQAVKKIKYIDGGNFMQKHVVYTINGGRDYRFSMIIIAKKRVAAYNRLNISCLIESQLLISTSDINHLDQFE